MTHCVIVGCNGYSQSKAKKLNTDAEDYCYFTIPKVHLHQCGKAKQLSERRRRKWLSRIYRRGILDANADNYFVYSRHFVSGRPSNLFDDRNPDWAPSVSLGYGLLSPNKSRYRRRKERSQRTGDRTPNHADEPDDGDKLDATRHSPALTAEIKLTPLAFGTRIS
ncbi:hypothetical protein HPB51_020173 [Rhipicephalus microplus]|uniref:THAP-type domain-containing protein n=1 Tax=Rhipicephalus microplus TaxID=6941 RepID=A0A9J6D6X6_RHIMP|nr:hypothetical protein HPB51_020173 [Rhipicephalus microplus]